MRPRILLPILAITAVTAGAYVVSSREPDRRWMRVARDANYEIAIDTARISVGRMWWGRIYTVYDVWYRTDHAVPRLHKDKSFSREVVRSIVQCDSLWFKVRSVDMSLGDELPIAQLRSSERELADQSWRRVERGTSEEIAAVAACHYGRRKTSVRP